MASKIHIPYYSVSNTIYVTIRDATGNVWNTSSKIFGVWSDLSLASYVINAVYKEGSLYVAQFPIDISNGYYTIMIFLQGAVSPNVSTDIWIGTLNSYWDKDNDNLVLVRVDTMVEYSSGETFTEKALEGVLTVNVNHDTEKVVIDRSGDPTFPIQRESSSS